MVGDFDRYFWDKVVTRLSTPEACKDTELWVEAEHKKANKKYIGAVAKSFGGLIWNILLLLGVGFLPRLSGIDIPAELASASTSNMWIDTLLKTTYVLALISLLSSIISAYGNRYRMKRITSFADEYLGVCDTAKQSNLPFEEAFRKEYDLNRKSLDALAATAAKEHWGQHKNVVFVSNWAFALSVTLAFGLVGYVARF